MTAPQLSTRLQIFSIRLTRFLAALCLALWIGGMAFFGIMAAPVLFHPEKSGIARAADTATLAPQLVSAMLTRFGTLTTICAIVLLICALIDGVLSRALKSNLWRAQSALSLLCLGFSLYLNGVLLPQTRREQAQILPLIARASRGETLSATDQARRSAFDSGHRTYQRLATINLYLLLAILFLLIARGADFRPPDVPKRSPNL